MKGKCYERAHILQTTWLIKSAELYSDTKNISCVELDWLTKGFLSCQDLNNWENWPRSTEKIFICSRNFTGKLWGPCNKVLPTLRASHQWDFKDFWADWQAAKLREQKKELHQCPAPAPCVWSAEVCGGMTDSWNSSLRWHVLNLIIWKDMKSAFQRPHTHTHTHTLTLTSGPLSAPSCRRRPAVCDMVAETVHLCGGVMAVRWHSCITLTRVHAQAKKFKQASSPRSYAKLHLIPENRCGQLERPFLRASSSENTELRTGWGHRTEWQEDLPLQQAPWWGVTAPDRCFVSLRAAWCGHCGGHFPWKAWRNPTPNGDGRLGMLRQTRPSLPLQNGAYVKPGINQ